MATNLVVLNTDGTHRGAHSADGITWSSFDMPSQINWTEAAWSPTLNLWAACSTDGVFASSIDGINWTPRSAALNAIWATMVWGNGIFVCLQTSGSPTTAQSQTSTDGKTWTTQTISQAASWINICYSPDLTRFVAVGASGAVMTSTNGIAWTNQTAAEANNWRSVCWSPALSLFVAVASSGTHRVMTSPDGFTWTPQTAASANFWRRVAWSPSLAMFVAVSSDNAGGNGQIMTSTNGTAWTARAAPAAVGWDGLVWSVRLGKFISNANGSRDMMTSTNGTSWSYFPTALPSSQNWFYLSLGADTAGQDIAELTATDILRTGTQIEIQDLVNGSDYDTADLLLAGINFDSPSQIAGFTGANIAEVDANTLAMHATVKSDEINYPGWQVGRYLFATSNFAYSATAGFTDSPQTLFSWICTSGIAVIKKVSVTMVFGTVTSATAGACKYEMFRVYGLSTAVNATNAVGPPSQGGSGTGLSPRLGSTGMKAVQPPSQMRINHSFGSVQLGYVDANSIAIVEGAAPTAGGKNCFMNDVLYDWKIAEQPLILTPGTGFQINVTFPGGTARQSHFFENIQWDEWTLVNPGDR